MRIISIMANISYIGRENYFLNILLDFLKQKVSLLVMNQWLSDKSQECRVSVCVSHFALTTFLQV